MLTWPHEGGDWAARLPEVEPVFIDITHHIVAHELALIVCRDAAHQTHIQTLFKQADVSLENIRLAIAPSDDAWARDHGPLGVSCQNQPRLLNYQFNGWGGKYNSTQDNAINRTLSSARSFGDTPMESISMVLEGGGIEVDGTGTLMTTEHCLLSPTRNPDLSREQIEKQLGEYLGINRFLWLKHGELAGDDTDGHIDTLARFCDPETITYIHCDDPQDEHYPDLQMMKQELQSFRTANGKPYKLVALPMPRAVYDGSGNRLPATYANFLIINNAVLVPTYQDANDQQALEILRSCFPDREVIGIDCLPLVQQYGSLHCLTLQLPTGVLT